MNKTEQKNYRAPALEKGLDIIELLSRTEKPLSTTQISTQLHRSKAELYRMLQVLESRGYVNQLHDGEGYVLTRKVLQLGTYQQPLKDLLEYSAPLMRKLASKTQQAVHIAVQSQEQMVVIARASAPGTISYSVHIGYRRPLVQSASGKVLFAFQTPQTKERWLDFIRPDLSSDELRSFLAATRKIAKKGYEKSPSGYVKGVIDLSVPIIDIEHAIAALTIPFIEHIPTVLSINKTTDELRSLAEEISAALKLGYSAPL